MNPKKKGNKGENAFANWMKEHGFNCFRNSGSGAGVWKGDIGNDLDITFEVKTVKKLNLLDAWRQVNRDASIAHNSPVLAIHYDNMPKDTWLIVLHSEDWVHLIKENKELKAKLKNK